MPAEPLKKYTVLRINGDGQEVERAHEGRRFQVDGDGELTIVIDGAKPVACYARGQWVSIIIENE